MVRNWLFVVVIPLVMGCTSMIDGWKELDLSLFKVSIPSGWKYVKEQGGDSFVGIIKTAKSELSFDCSNQGFANRLIKSEKEYLRDEDWTDQVDFEPDSNTKSKIYKPTSFQIKKYPQADYIAELIYKGEKKIVLIQLPVEIRRQHIKLDTTSKYYIKTIWPKVAGKGMTGVYIHSRSSSFNFQMAGENLSAQDQECALKAFKTITFKK
jgi:hypothetical protein